MDIYGEIQDEQIKEHLTRYCEKHGWDPSNEMFWEVLLDAKKKYTGEPQRHRWWNEYFCVVEIDGLEIGFYQAESTGDNCPWELGWEPDLRYVSRVEKHETTQIVTTYTPIPG